MDAGQFDSFSRALSQGVSRRMLTSLLGGLALGRSLGSHLNVAQAKKGGKGHGGGGKHNKKNDKKNDRPHCGGGTFRCPTFDGSGTHCVSLLDDVLNCGECNNQCGHVGTVYYRCRNGFCELCPEHSPNVCGGPGATSPNTCVNILTDPAHCGGCTSAHVCRPRQECRDGHCVCPGQACQNGSCCPEGYACVGEGTGCCPTDYHSCGNGICCPSGFNCGGRCGQDCCR